MGIITTIPTNLNFPNRGVLERDAFVNAQEIAQDLLAGAYTAALNQYATELNSTQADINTKAEQVYNQAVTGGYSQAYIDATFTPKILNTQTAKTTPVDADLIPLSDSASSFGLKKLSWANLKATLKTYFDTLYTVVASSETVSGIIEIATTAEAQAGTDDLKAITPLKLKNSVIGLGQVYQDLTGNRLLGTNFTNSTGKPIVVTVHSVSTAGSGGMTLTPIVDGVILPYTASYYTGAGFSSTCSFIVPNGAVYSVSGNNAVSTRWVELR